MFRLCLRQNNILVPSPHMTHHRGAASRAEVTRERRERERERERERKKKREREGGRPRLGFL